MALLFILLEIAKMGKQEGKTSNRRPCVLCCAVLCCAVLFAFSLVRSFTRKFIGIYIRPLITEMGSGVSGYAFVMTVNEVAMGRRRVRERAKILFITNIIDGLGRLGDVSSKNLN